MLTIFKDWADDDATAILHVRDHTIAPNHQLQAGLKKYGAAGEKIFLEIPPNIQNIAYDQLEETLQRHDKLSLLDGIR